MTQLYKTPGVKYIVVEGIDAAGKDTAVAYIEGLFKELNKQVIVINHGYGSALGREIIAGIKRGDVEPDEEINKLFMLWLDRLQYVQQQIEILLGSHPAEDIVVVFNRFTDSTYLYQCIMKHGSVSLFKNLENFLKQYFTPDLTILLTCSQRTQIERLKGRELAGEGTDVSESKCITNHNAMTNAYLSRFYERNEGAVIQTDGDLHLTKTKILSALQKYFSYM